MSVRTYPQVRLALMRDSGVPAGEVVPSVAAEQRLQQRLHPPQQRLPRSAVGAGLHVRGRRRWSVSGRGGGCCGKDIVVATQSAEAIRDKVLRDWSEAQDSEGRRHGPARRVRATAKTHASEQAFQTRGHQESSTKG